MSQRDQVWGMTQHTAGFGVVNGAVKKAGVRTVAYLVVPASTYHTGSSGPSPSDWRSGSRIDINLVVS